MFPPKVLINKFFECSLSPIPIRLRKFLLAQLNAIKSQLYN